jgi:hypothetical protein
MSPELETLDQLVGGDLSLSVVRQFFPNTPAFLRGVHGLLKSGDVRLIGANGSDIPDWRWRELFADGVALTAAAPMFLSLTEQGAMRIK